MYILLLVSIYIYIYYDTFYHFLFFLRNNKKSHTKLWCSIPSIVFYSCLVLEKQLNTQPLDKHTLSLVWLFFSQIFVWGRVSENNTCELWWYIYYTDQFYFPWCWDRAREDINTNVIVDTANERYCDWDKILLSSRIPWQDIRVLKEEKSKN